MGIKGCKRLVPALALLSAAVPAFAQEEAAEQKDSLVRLMQGSSLQLVEVNSRKFRKAVDATFLHNGTYLVCDTALWNVDDKIINAWGNVKLIQEETVLTSSSLDYKIDENLAEFRGDVVQLRNKENNTLRAANLDYNTKDSTAIFQGGGSMKDKDGQIIESTTGIYDSKSKVFVFDKNVNMFTDSVFVKTSHMMYNSDNSVAYFTNYIDFWKDDNMLSAGGGWYDRTKEVFFFNNDVHGLTDRQESWSDTMYVYRNTKEVEMRGGAQIQDTSRHVTAMAEYMHYSDSSATITMRDQAAVVMSTKEKDKVDTIYAGADVMIYRSIRRCDIPGGTVSEAQTRLKNITFDAVAEFRRKAAEAAQKAKEDAEAKAMEDDPNAGPRKKKEEKKEETEVEEQREAPEEKPGEKPEGKPGEGPGEGPGERASAPDSLSAGLDSLSAGKDSLAVGRDSLASVTDTVPPLPDTTKFGFVTATGKVRIYRRDLQLRCDSLNYCDLDSIARFYIEPIVWNDGNRQYTSDSLYALIRGGRMDRASLMGNAFIITREDSIRFDQIKSTEVVAYFDSSSALKRFDALGGANAMFYLKENGTLATVNKVESKMLSAIMSGGQLDKVYYYESPKNDAFPVAQMTERDHTMKGFEWKADQQPRGPEDITVLVPEESQREYYESRPKAKFVETERFFPGYMQSVYSAIEEARLRRDNPVSGERQDTLAPVIDSLGAALDSVIVGGDSLKVDLADSLSGELNPAQADSILETAPAVDAVADTADVHVPTERELRAAAREEARKIAIARRDARWAEMDARDAQKAAAREQKKLEKKRARTRKLLILQALRDAKDDAKREKYVKYYEKKKAREDSLAALRAVKEAEKQQDTTNEQKLEPSGERTPETVAGGDVQTFDGDRREPR